MDYLPNKHIVVKARQRKARMQTWWTEHSQVLTENNDTKLNTIAIVTNTVYVHPFIHYTYNYVDQKKIHACNASIY